MDKKIQEKISKILEKLRQNQCVILPSDTLYGLASRAYSKEAVSRVFALKNRPLDKKLPIHYSSLEMLESDVKICPTLAKLAENFWPGALTIVAKKQQNSKLQYLDETVGIRIPNHPVLLAIIAELGEPLTMPSANKHQQNPELEFEKVQKSFGKIASNFWNLEENFEFNTNFEKNTEAEKNFEAEKTEEENLKVKFQQDKNNPNPAKMAKNTEEYLYGIQDDNGIGKTASTIVDISEKEIKFLRIGAISKEKIMEIL